MAEAKNKPLSKAQLAVIRNLLSRKLRYLIESARTDRQAQFEVDRKRYEAEITQYNADRVDRVLNEARRRPSTYIVKHNGSPGVIILDSEALSTWYEKKYGTKPVEPKHPSADKHGVFFASLDDGYGHGCQVEVPLVLKDQVEALAQKLDIAVLNGQAEGIVEAINALTL